MKFGIFKLDRPNPLRAITMPRRIQVTKALGAAVSSAPYITQEAYALARELCFLSGGNPDEIVHPSRISKITSSGAITCLPEIPPPMTGFPMWMIIAAEARWGAKAQHEAPIANRAKHHGRPA